MRISFNISHPAHIRLFRNAPHTPMSRGHECKVTVVYMEPALNLLDLLCLEYNVVGCFKLMSFGKDVALCGSVSTW